MNIPLHGDGPAYRQIYRHIRTNILDGALAPGTRLPATRRLAAELGVARITVVQAYEQLTAEGYLKARPGHGTRVADDLGNLSAEREAASAPAPRLSAYGRRIMEAAPAGNDRDRARAFQCDFQYGQPGLSPELLADWKRALRKAAGRLPVAYPDPAGDPDLRECLAVHLHQRRGIRADPAQILIVSGTQQALELIGRCLLDPGDRVVIEEPHYQGARYTFAALEARLVPVPVDAEGLETDQLPEDPPGPRLACVTPSHQFPLGGVLPVARRLALLEWAGRRRAMVIEDDYDSEYRHEGPPLQSLYGLDQAGRVLYAGTLSKVLSPALRLGYLVVPEPWIEPLTQLKWLTDRGSPILEQRALVELFRSGAFRRHLERTGRRLARCRQRLVAALEHQFGDRITILGAQSGMHLVVRFRALDTDQVDRLIELAAAKGVGVYSTARYYASGRRQPDLLLGYGALDAEQVPQAIARLRAAFDELRPRVKSQRPA